jgi:hypothetical protein
MGTSYNIQFSQLMNLFIYYRSVGTFQSFLTDPVIPWLLPFLKQKTLMVSVSNLEID